MDRNYCLIVFIVYMSYSDTQKVAKCWLYEKKSMLKKKKKGGASQGPVHTYLWAYKKKQSEVAYPQKSYFHFRFNTTSGLKIILISAEIQYFAVFDQFYFLSNNVGIHFVFTYYFLIHPFRLVPGFSGIIPQQLPITHTIQK